MASETEMIRHQMEGTRKDLADKVEQLEAKVAGTVESVSETVGNVTETVQGTVEGHQELAASKSISLAIGTCETCSSLPRFDAFQMQRALDNLIEKGRTMGLQKSTGRPSLRGERGGWRFAAKRRPHTHVAARTQHDGDYGHNRDGHER